MFLIMTDTIEWLSLKSIDLYSFAQMSNTFVSQSIQYISRIKRTKIAEKIACGNGPFKVPMERKIRLYFYNLAWFILMR